MAKKINRETIPDEIISTTQTGNEETPVIVIENKNATEEVAQTEIPPFVKPILQSHKSYEYLYVDAQGGVYTPGTAPLIRKKAVLYRNPFYNHYNE